MSKSKELKSLVSNIGNALKNRQLVWHLSQIVRVIKWKPKGNQMGE